MSTTRPAQVIAIDGPAGAGKSTIAKLLAQRLGFAYLDTGAMYRALTLKALRAQVPLENEESLVRLAGGTLIDLKPGGAGIRVFLDGEDVSEAIRSHEVTNKTFFIAQAPRVREVMVQWQRDLGQRQNVVMEGRDVGTVVFPQADFKFYLDADFAERARRRLQELQNKGQPTDAGKLSQELQERDQKDFTRQVGPLKKAPDAVVIDSTRLSIEQVVETMSRVVQDRKERKGSGDG